MVENADSRLLYSAHHQMVEKTFISCQSIPTSSAILSWRLGSFEDGDLLAQSHSSWLTLVNVQQHYVSMSFHVIPCPTWIRTTELTWPNTRLLLVVSSCPVDVQTSAFHGLFFLFFLYTTFCHRSTSSQHSRLSSPAATGEVYFQSYPICRVKSYPILSNHSMMNTKSGMFGCSSQYIEIWYYRSSDCSLWVKWPAVFHQSLRPPLPKSTKCELKSTASKAGNVVNYEWVKYTSLIIWYDLFSLFQLFSTHYPFHHNNSQHTVLIFSRGLKHLHPEEGWRHHKPIR